MNHNRCVRFPFLFLHQELGPRALPWCLGREQVPRRCSHIHLLRPEVFAVLDLTVSFFRSFVLGALPNLRSAWRPTALEARATGMEFRDARLSDGSPGSL